MIKTFKHKGLAELFRDGASAKVDQKLQERIVEMLDALDRATKPGHMAVPGYDFHPLRGHKPRRYTVHVNGPWCITFEFDEPDAFRVDLEQYQ